MKAELRYGPTVVRVSLGELVLLRARAGRDLAARIATIEEALRQGQAPTFSEWDVFLGGDPSECRATMVLDLLQSSLRLVYNAEACRWEGWLLAEDGHESPELFTMQPYQPIVFTEGAFKEAIEEAESRAAWYCGRRGKEG